MNKYSVFHFTLVEQESDVLRTAARGTYEEKETVVVADRAVVDNTLTFLDSDGNPVAAYASGHWYRFVKNDDNRTKSLPVMMSILAEGKIGDL